MKYSSLYGKMFNYEQEFVGKNLVRLESMDYDSSIFKIPKIYKYAVDLMFKHNTLTYSDFSGFGRFKKLIRKFEDAKSGLINSKNFVFVGSGVSSLIYPTIESILSLKINAYRKKVIVFRPDYPIFESVIEKLGGKVVSVEGERDNNFIVKINDVIKKIDSEVSMIVFSYPNNPTCNYQSREFFCKLVEISRTNNIFLVSDEIYRESFYNKDEYVNIATINKGYTNFVRLCGLSKDRPGMTGLRCGYCIADTVIEKSFMNNQLIRNFSGNIISDYLFMIDTSLRYYKLTKEKFEDFKYYPDKLIDDYFATVEHNANIQINYNKKVADELLKNKNIIDIIEPRCGNSVLFRYKNNLPPWTFLKEMINNGLAIYPCDAFSISNKLGSWGRVCVTKNIKYLSNGIKKI